MLPTITISRIERFDALYPHYENGHFLGLPSGWTPTKFNDFLCNIRHIYAFHGIYYNGELIAVVHIAKADGVKNVSATWFTESKRKRATSLKEFINKAEFDMVMFATSEESDGFFALARRGIVNFQGKYNNMNEFTA